MRRFEFVPLLSFFVIVVRASGRFPSRYLHLHISQLRLLPAFQPHPQLLPPKLHLKRSQLLQSPSQSHSRRLLQLLLVLARPPLSLCYSFTVAGVCTHGLFHACSGVLAMNHRILRGSSSRTSEQGLCASAASWGRSIFVRVPLEDFHGPGHTGHSVGWL